MEKAYDVVGLYFNPDDDRAPGKLEEGGELCHPCFSSGAAGPMCQTLLLAQLP
ncbi:hypothetical protein [Streptomyces phaeochromogenes]|uniref:hypothetical protein n=1 Tax=Streptomyces phaeochromogenes TaxID=1923 RepID=UPI003722EB25